MPGIDNSLTLGVGNVSFDTGLGMYYQDISPSIVHIKNGIFASLDEDGIPYVVAGKSRKYYIILTIQYGLSCYDLLQKEIEIKENTLRLQNCLNWIDDQKEEFKDSYVWRSDYNEQYSISKGWISGMYQGQAISLYLRAYQLFNIKRYLNTAEKTFSSFSIDYEDGGFKRIDDKGCIWFEEYPTEKPSFVLNGFIYAMFGILDFYRVTKRTDAKLLWESCVHTLIVNLPKYDVWYWSVYDQLKQELVSYYYQKNVHLPLMKIMFELTDNQLFEEYAVKWERNLNNPIHRLITKIMYRIQPRIKKFKRSK
jgi:heparosan-N-sulfate-glucuronate 5-epimerase